jgi:glutamate racemase
LSKSPRILVFDSGVGGLSIADIIMQQHPHCSLIYASDNAAFPYGTKPEDELVTRVDKVLHALQSISNADIIVVACNTASTLALPIIRARFNIPIIGVVPAIKPAAKISKTKVIGLLATPATISRPYTQALIEEHAKGCSIIKLGSSDLVNLAEDALRNPNISKRHDYLQQLKILVQPFTNEPMMDTVVLACTHFPLLREPLTTVLPHIQHWVDSGEAIAQRVGYWLNELGMSNNKNTTFNRNNALTIYHQSIFTAKHKTIDTLIPALNIRDLGNIEVLDLPHPSTLDTI